VAVFFDELQEKSNTAPASKIVVVLVIERSILGILLWVLKILCQSLIGTIS
jgi:hypothetical protein